MKNIVIIYGGPGSEHEVSIKSAFFVYDILLKAGFKIDMIFVDKNMNWNFKNKKTKINILLKNLKNTLFFPLIHGDFGEDGKLQKILEKNNIKYIGTKAKESKITINKFKTQQILEKNKILCPKAVLLKNYTVKHNLKYPIIIKPIASGSSVGLYKISNEIDFKKQIKSILKKWKNVVAQEFITGREFTCGIIEINEKIKTLSPSEIILTKTKLFDYEAKYTKNACTEITPAKIDRKLKKQIQNLALKTHLSMNCKDISRTDMILDRENNLYVLEINTIPGMTETSFIPQQLNTDKIKLEKLLSYFYKKYK